MLTPGVLSIFFFGDRNKMPREPGPERAHFGGEDGLITEITTGGRRKYFWRCMYCSFIIGGKNGTLAIFKINTNDVNEFSVEM